MALLSSLASSCAGTSTGNPVKPPDKGDIATGEVGNCYRDVETLDGHDADTPHGFTAAEMLALANSQREVAIDWRQPNGGLTYGPEVGRGTLTIEVDSRGKAPRFVDRRPHSSKGGEETGLALADIGSFCPDVVELDV